MNTRARLSSGVSFDPSCEPTDAADCSIADDVCRAGGKFVVVDVVDVVVVAFVIAASLPFFQSLGE